MKTALTLTLAMEKTSFFEVKLLKDDELINYDSLPKIKTVETLIRPIITCFGPELNIIDITNIMPLKVVSWRRKIARSDVVL